MKFKYTFLSLVTLALMWNCKNPEELGERKIVTEEIRYEAQLSALNSHITGLETSGKAEFLLSNDTLFVTIEVENAPPNIQHWQNFHGTPAADDTRCPTMADDKNKDGIIDMFEVGPASGRMMVPFNANPALMNIGDFTYPTADENGYYKYEKAIPMEDLANNFANSFGGYDIHLDKDAIYIHGVPEDTNLPSSVKSISGVPNYLTLPIACGKIKRID